MHWRTFLQSLTTRGLCGVRLLISDDHSGLKAARKAVFGGVPWQRCQFHLQQNAQAYVLKQEHKAPVAEAIRAIFNAPTREQAEGLLCRYVGEWSKTNPKLALWAEANLPEGLTRPGLSRSASAFAAHDQWLGAGQPGSAATNAGVSAVSQ